MKLAIVAQRMPAAMLREKAALNEPPPREFAKRGASLCL